MRRNKAWGLPETFSFNRKEGRVLHAKDMCRLATLNWNGWPHCVPVGYVFLRGTFYIPAYRNSTKVRNLRTNNKATIVIDDEGSEAGVMVECRSTILQGDKAERLREYMRKVKGWKNDETTVVIKLEPTRKASWFLR